MFTTKLTGKLSPKLTALAAATVIGGTALSGIAVAQNQSAGVAAGSDTFSISVRAHKGDSGVFTTLSDGHQVQIWNYADSGTVWLYAPWLDHRSCTLEPVVTAGRPGLATHEDYLYRDWTGINLWTASGTARQPGTVDITLTCPASAVIAGQGFAGGFSASRPPRRH